MGSFIHSKGSSTSHLASLTHILISMSLPPNPIEYLNVVLSSLNSRPTASSKTRQTGVQRSKDPSLFLHPPNLYPEWTTTI